MDNEYYHSQEGSESENLPLAAQALINISLFLLLAPVGLFFVVLGFKLLL